MGVPNPEKRYNLTWMDRLNLENLVLTSRAICTAALARTDSRGAHFREDFPAKSDAYSTFNIVIQKGTDGAMQLSRVTVPQIPPELQQVIEENK